MNSEREGKVEGEFLLMFAKLKFQDENALMTLTLIFKVFLYLRFTFCLVYSTFHHQTFRIWFGRRRLRCQPQTMNDDGLQWQSMIFGFS